MNSAIIQNAVAILRRGGLVAFPTETVYGLGADAKNPTAIERIYKAKGRPSNHPIIVHITSYDQLKDWAKEITPQAEKLAKHFWPGPLTLILPRAKHVLDSITGSQDTIGIRIPNHPIAQALLMEFGGGIAAPSANRFGHVSPTRAEHVREELTGVVDLILEGGECAVGIESTIVDVVGNKPKIIRPGMITAHEISTLLGEEVAGQDSLHTIRAPGLLPSHYAPQTSLQIIAKNDLQHYVKEILENNKKVAVVAQQAALCSHTNLIWKKMSDESKKFAHDLYVTLREVDKLSCDLILVEELPKTEEWLAINDRLQKAAAKK